MHRWHTLIALALGIGGPGAALAQATVVPDGQWRASLGLGASASSGNTEASTFSLVGDAVRATDQDKVSLYGNAQYARSEGETTGEQIRLGGRYDWNLSPEYFAFGGLDFERNKFANLQLRSQLGAGLGLHLIKGPATTWDVFGGLAYTSDRFIDPMVVDDQMRSSYGYTSMLLGEESTHKFGESTTAKQRLVVYPNLRNRGEYRTTWDAGAAVAMSKTLNLTVGFTFAYNSEPGEGRKSTDTLLTAGVSVKFE